MHRLPYLPALEHIDPDLACWLIFEQLEFLHADGRLDPEVWQLVCAFMREHQALTAAMRGRDSN